MTDEATDPFDETQRIDSGTLTPAPRPGLAERFLDNFEAAQRTGTLAGATRDALEIDGAADREAFERRYDSLPGWEGLLEGAAALGGQLAGTATGIENYVPLGIGVRMLGALGRTGTGVGARVVAGATDAAVANAVIDAGIQGVEIAGGNRDSFDATQLGASVALGAAVGGAAGGVGALFGRRDGYAEAPVTDPPAAATALPGEAAVLASEPPPPARGPEPAAAIADEAGAEIASASVPDAVTARADGAADASLEDGAAPAIGERLQVAGEARAAGADVAAGMRIVDQADGGATFASLNRHWRSRAASRRPDSGTPTPQDGAPASPGFTRLQEISNRLADAVAVRQGRPGICQARRTYNIKTGALRMKHQDDWSIFMYGIGHAVQARYRLGFGQT